MAKPEPIDISVRRRILWIGAEAYPLHNIARARVSENPADRGPYIKRFATLVCIAVLLELFGSGKLGGIAIFLPTRSLELGYAPIIALCLLGIGVFNLVRALKKQPIYGLVIETTGAPFTRFASPNIQLVMTLVQQIMEAISNPVAEFQYQVENYYGGIHTKQTGDHNIGTVNL